MMCKKKILSFMTALYLLISITLPVFAVSEVPEYKYDSDLPLGIATDFHMFIKGDASLNAHCFGNIAVGNLVSVNSTFGQALIKDDKGNSVRRNDLTNYIKNLSTNFSVAFFGSPFVFGKGAEVVITDNGNKNKVKMNGFSTTEMPFNDCKMFVEDEAKPFIDLDKEFINLKKLSKEYANTVNSGDVQTKFDMNSGEIKALTEGINVKNIKFKDTIALCNQAELKVFVNNTEKSTIIINVDMAGAGDEVEVPVKTRFNGEGNKERCDSENSKILWNFYDSSKNDNIYDGTLNFKNEWVGSIMAPGAKVNFLGVNFDGTLIADSCFIGGESHSWYYTGDKPEDPKPTKPEPTKPEPTTTTSSEITTTTPKPTTTTSSEITTTTPKPTTTTSSEITTTTPKPTTTTSSEITTTTPKPTTTTPSEITTTTPKPTTTTPSEITTTTPKPTTTTSGEITTTTPMPTTTTSSEITTTTPKPTTTTSSEITTTTPEPTQTRVTSTKTVTQPKQTTTTPTTHPDPEPLIVTNPTTTTTTVTTSLVNVPENPTPQQIRRTLSYIDELLKKDDLTPEQEKELKQLRRTLALMLENSNMPNTGTDNRRATPVVLGGLFLAMGIYGFFNRKKLIDDSSKK